MVDDYVLLWGEPKSSCFPYSPETVGAVSSTTCFLSPHMLGPPVFFLLFAFTGIFQETQKYLSSPHSLPMQCWNRASTKPDLTRQYSSAQRETQTFPNLFSSACYYSGCLAPVWSFRFLLLMSNSDFSVVPARKEMCQISLHFAEFGVSQSSQVNTGLC